MAKAALHLNGHRQRTFHFNGATVTILRPTNRDRERMRQLSLRLSSMNLGYSNSTLAEFTAAVTYTLSGDEGIWNRPSPESTNTELAVAFEQWLDVDADYVDELFLAQAGNPNPTTAPQPPGDNADPNS